MTILELSWFLNKFNVCTQPGILNKVYVALSWFDTWRKAALYGVAGIVCVILSGPNCSGLSMAGKKCVMFSSTNFD